MLFGLESFIDVAFSEGIGPYLGALSDGFRQLAAVDPEAIAPFLGSYELEGAAYTVELREGGAVVGLDRRVGLYRAAGSTRWKLRCH